MIISASFCRSTYRLPHVSYSSARRFYIFHRHIGRTILYNSTVHFSFFSHEINVFPLKCHVMNLLSFWNISFVVYPNVNSDLGVAFSTRFYNISYLFKLLYLLEFGISNVYFACWALLFADHYIILYFSS